MEVWKRILGHEDYEVSNLGNVKSLERLDNMGRLVNEKILKPSEKNGYLYVNLYKQCKCKKARIHQLVSVAFLDHIPNGKITVVNHKNFIRTDNRLENLELVTMRENGNQKHLKSSSKYTGVSWHNKNKKWQSSIYINGKLKYLGQYINEIDASLAYQNKLKEITNE